MDDGFHDTQGNDRRFEIKDSGERQEFEGGMVRDTDDGKTNYLSLLFGPMLRRWAEHLTKGRLKYPDPEPGVPNWTLAEGQAEYVRFRESAFRHFIAWLNDERDEDHAAGVFFNINGAEYVRDKMRDKRVCESPSIFVGPTNYVNVP